MNAQEQAILIDKQIKIAVADSLGRIIQDIEEAKGLLMEGGSDNPYINASAHAVGIVRNAIKQEMITLKNSTQ